jgi:hypothetical protein
MMTLYERLREAAKHIHGPGATGALLEEAAEGLMKQAKDAATLRGRIEQLSTQVANQRDYIDQLERKLGI